jgi:hypothetical protein
MKELYYFKGPDLMVAVSYKKNTQQINYLSHRQPSPDERKEVEQYLKTKVTVKSSCGQKCQTVLIYDGVDNKLKKTLRRFHQKHFASSLKGREKEVEQSVQELIHQSLSNYYFEQIGNTLLELRRLSETTGDRDLSARYIAQLKVLVQAYNVYAEKPVTTERLLQR